MPELPEVETVRRQLAHVWTGRTIERVHTSRPSYFFVSSPRLLRTRLVGQTLEHLERQGKYLVAHFQDQTRLLLHLGMTGQLVARALPVDPHVHLVLHLGDEVVLTFRDVRKFGKVEWIAKGKSSPRLDKLGPDALTAVPAEVALSLRKRAVPLKTALLDQKIWAGVGNIYADEALYRAQVRPTRPARDVALTRLHRVVEETQHLLQLAVAHGGSTINDYIQPDGDLGGFQDFHRVYGKTGFPCPGCGRPIQRLVIGGRSTHFCSRCQK